MNIKITKNSVGVSDNVPAAKPLRDNDTGSIEKYKKDEW